MVAKLLMQLHLVTKVLLLASWFSKFVWHAPTSEAKKGLCPQFLSLMFIVK